MVITIYVWNTYLFYFYDTKKIFVELASLNMFSHPWIDFLRVFFIIQSILHPVSQNCKIIWSWDKIGIEYTGSQLYPDFFHTKPKSVTPDFWLTHIFTFTKIFLSNYFSVYLNVVKICRFVEWDASEGTKRRDKTIIILVLSHNVYL